MFTPNPVEAFFRHAQCNDDVHVVTVELLGGVFQCVNNVVTLRRVIIYKVGDSQDSAIRKLHKLKAC